jgi:signal recognition particle subunit SRP54
MAKVEASALGKKVLKGIKPDQQLVKVVNDQLIELMGGTQEGLVEVKAGQMQVDTPSAL